MNTKHEEPEPEEVDLTARHITIPLNVLAELLDANAAIEYGHSLDHAGIHARGVERHHEILTGLGLTGREITDLDDAAAGAADAWRP